MLDRLIADRPSDAGTAGPSLLAQRLELLGLGMSPTAGSRLLKVARAIRPSTARVAGTQARGGGGVHENSRPELSTSLGAGHAGLSSPSAAEIEL
jgi:hypothetical protein